MILNFKQAYKEIRSDYNYRLDQSAVIISGAQLMNYGLNEPEDFKWGDFKGK
jgi:hypothetical protein